MAARAPDVPHSINLLETSAVQIGLSWSTGAYNGGQKIIDYQVSYKSSIELFVNVTETETVIKSLTPGETYIIKVRSRN
jgi:hypothetical protein